MVGLSTVRIAVLLIAVSSAISGCGGLSPELEGNGSADTFTATGVVKTPGGAGVPGVSVSFGTFGTAITNADGTWTKSGLSGIVEVQFPVEDISDITLRRDGDTYDSTFDDADVIFLQVPIPIGTSVPFMGNQATETSMAIKKSTRSGSFPFLGIVKFEIEFISDGETTDYSSNELIDYTLTWD